MENAVITDAQINRPDLRWPFPDRMADRLMGKRVTALRRRSKYILADLDSGESLLIHLGMSGRMTVSGDPLGQFVHSHPAPVKHDHVVLTMDNGARITFNDPRRFGAMDLIPLTNQGDHKLLAGIGPEPLGNAFHDSYLISALAGRKSPIKNALLDQRIVAGLGNIYVCETLFRAQLSPLRVSGEIPATDVAKMIPIIRTVLQDAITAGGSSLKDFRRADGELGYFQHSFDVYGREGDPCRRNGCAGQVIRVVQSARSSFYCPQCQR
jgi:formamidopyrimidine-DNA glycosylase